jgi:hypothetical protein
MKRIVLIQLLLGCILYSSAQDAIIKKLPNGVVPTIDGTIESLWTSIDAQNISRAILSGTPTVTSYWKAAWNEDAFYILISVIDDAHCDQWCSEGQVWESDKAGLFFDMNKIITDGAGPVSNPNGHYTVAEDFAQNVANIIKSGTNWMGVGYNFAYKITGNNYVVEYALSWATLRDKYGSTFNPLVDDKFGFDVEVIDRDSKIGLVNTAIWRNRGTSGTNWNNMDSCGVVGIGYPSRSLKLTSPSGNIISSGASYTMLVNSNQPNEFIIKNKGEQTLNISSLSISGAGYTLAMSAKRNLPFGDTLRVKVLFAENASNNFNGALQIVSNDATSSTYTVNIASEKPTVINTGNVSGSWTKANSPYLILGDVTIPNGNTLTIEAGVTVKFNGNYSLKAEGRLLALGKEGDSIRFTVNNAQGFSNYSVTDGGWRGLDFSSNGPDNDTSKLEYCVLEYAKKLSATAFGSGDGGALFVAGAKKIKISNCLFRNNYAGRIGGAIAGVNNYGTPAEIHVTNSTFYNNASNNGGAIYIDGLSRCWVTGCKIINNKVTDSGGGLMATDALLYVTRTFISNNISTAVGGGIALVVSNSYFANNTISNNQSKNGGGINVNNCIPQFYNNNICYNRSVEEYGGGLLVWDMSPALFVNNIFWGNVSSIAGTDYSNQINLTGFGQPNFYNCVLEGGFDAIARGGAYRGDTAKIFSSNPQFVSVPAGAGIGANGLLADWNLNTNSPIINKGKDIVVNQLDISRDLYNNKRVLHNIIDVGAVEKHIESANVQGIITNDASWVADTIRVTGDITIQSNAKLTIAPGTVVEFQGHYKFKVFGSLFSKGYPNAMIKFTIKDTTGFANSTTNNGSWDGICLNNSYWDGANYAMPVNDTTIIENTIIEYAKNMQNNWDKTIGGAIQIKYYSNVRVSNCIIRKNIAANGAGIQIEGFSNPIIINNKIYSNYVTGNGAGINVIGNSNPKIIGNFISNNIGNAGAVNFNASNPVFINNIISNNYSSGSGGGVVLTNSYPVFSNNTIVNNLTKYEGGGLFIYECTPKIYNTIFWENKALSGAQSVSSFGNSELINCIVQPTTDGSWVIEGRLGAVVKEVNLTSGNPKFIKPSTSYGNSFDFQSANWAISNFSSAVNKGSDNFGYVIAIDYIGNLRFNETIDIGALENQGAKLLFSKQPVGKQLCMGDSIVLSVVVSDTANFQWLKDGLDIAGATSPILKIKNINDKNAGSYVCKASNAYGNVYSNSVTLLGFLRKPKTELIKPITYVDASLETAILPNSSGDEPLTYKWFKNGSLISDKTQKDLLLSNISKADEALYKCRIINVCDSIETNETKLVIAPQICMVSNINLTNNKNVVVWDRNSGYTYSSFNIYRESSIKDKYIKIGSLPYNSLTTFSDDVVNPKSQAFMYKITAVDEKGKETDIMATAPHKTIHLLVTMGVPKGIQLDWDDYIGFEYGTYDIFRSVDNGNFAKVHSMSSTSRTWTDFDAPNTKDLRYYVSVSRTSPCEANPLQKKAGAGPFASAVSNMEDNSRLKFVETGIASLQNENISVYPNPFNQMTKISYRLENNTLVDITLTDLSGRRVEKLVQSNQQVGEYSIKIGEKLNPGIYILRVSFGNNISKIRIVKIK